MEGGVISLCQLKGERGEDPNETTPKKLALFCQVYLLLEKLPLHQPTLGFRNCITVLSCLGVP
jgi:hypothetical protein